MLFIAMAKFKKELSKEVVEQNLKDIETDAKGNIRYTGIWWTLGKYDTVVMFEAPDEKAAMWCLNVRKGWTSRRWLPSRLMPLIRLDRCNLKSEDCPILLNINPGENSLLQLGF